MFSTEQIASLWNLMWAWVLENSSIIIVGFLTLVLVFPVVFLAIETIAHAVRQHNGLGDNLLPVLHHGVAPAPVVLRSGLEWMEEGCPASSWSSPPNIQQMMFPNVQPAPSPSERRMLRMLQGMYVLLGKTLDGATNYLSAVERMHAACSLVSRTVATLTSWRAPAAVVALLQPAKEVTTLFSRRSTKTRLGAMSKGRQAHYVALLKKRAQTMEELLSYSLWAGTMPAVPMGFRDALPIIALAERLDASSHKKDNPNSTTGKLGRKDSVDIAPGIQYIPYPGAFQLADRSVLQ